MLSKKCECFYLTELNMEINVISKKYIRVCSKHSEEIFTGPVERKQYRFCKKKKIYHIKDSSSLSTGNAIDLELVDKSNTIKFGLQSKDSVESLNSNDSTISNDSSIIDSLIMKNCGSKGDIRISFGKYKGLTFNELLKKDKKYCINIMNIESERDSKTLPSSMSDLSKYVKEYIEKN